MQAASREALVTSRERLDQQTGSPQGSRADGQALLTLADDLFSVAHVLDGQVSLRRALADASVQPDGRAGLAERLLRGKIGDGALDVVQTVARQRWSRPLDLVEAVETLATDAALHAAQARGELDTVEDELFRFGRIVDGDAALARLLGDPAADRQGKTVLLDRLLAGKVSPVTERLVRNSLTSRHVHDAAGAVERISEAASARRGRSVAHVTSAVELTDQQRRRLTAILERTYGRTISLQVEVEPEIVGGLVIRVGDEIVDGSIAHRLQEAGRRFAG